SALAIAPPARPCTAPAAQLPPPTTALPASRRHPRLTLGVSRHLLDDDTMPPLIRVTLTPTVRGCPPIWHQLDKNGALTSSAIPSAVLARLGHPPWPHATPSPCSLMRISTLGRCLSTPMIGGSIVTPPLLSSGNAWPLSPSRMRSEEHTSEL